MNYFYNESLHDNVTILTRKYLLKVLKSENFLETTRIINIILTIIAILIGLLGNTLTIIVFYQKKFRTNSSNVFLFCLAINDNLFLIIHFFEDTIRTYKDLFIDSKMSDNDSFDKFIRDIIITDKFEISCRLVNYLRCILRFISAYIIIAFTLQRVKIIYSPLAKYFKTKTSAWITIVTLILISIIVNIWVPFLFELRVDNDKKYCDVKKDYKLVYFHFTIAYICLIILLPILIIFISNTLIISKLKAVDLKKKEIKLVTFSENDLVLNDTKRSDMMSCKRNVFFEDCVQNTTSSSFDDQIFYFLKRNKIWRISNMADDSKKITKTLVIISFSYALLNMPYLIIWAVYFYEIAFLQADLPVKNYLFSALQICEIIHILNYCLNFYIYRCSSSIFRNQLSYSGKQFISF